MLKLIRKVTRKDDKVYYNYYLEFEGLKVAIKPVFKNDNANLKVISILLKAKEQQDE